jgi:hypothetical protein
MPLIGIATVTGSADALVGRSDGVDHAVVIEPVLAGRELGIDHVDVDGRGGERRAGGVAGGGGDVVGPSSIR